MRKLRFFLTLKKKKRMDPSDDLNADEMNSMALTGMLFEELEA